MNLMKETLYLAIDSFDLFIYNSLQNSTEMSLSTYRIGYRDGQVKRVFYHGNLLRIFCYLRPGSGLFLLDKFLFLLS